MEGAIYHSIPVAGPETTRDPWANMKEAVKEFRRSLEAGPFVYSSQDKPISVIATFSEDGTVELRRSDEEE